MKLEGEDEQYDFEIYPIDIAKSKYCMTTCPQSHSWVNSSAVLVSLQSTTTQAWLSKIRTSKSRNWDQKDGRPRKARKDNGQDSRSTKERIQWLSTLEIKSFYLEYTKDGVKWIRVESRLFLNQHINSDSPKTLKENGIITIYFTWHSRPSNQNGGWRVRRMASL